MTTLFSHNCTGTECPLCAKDLQHFTASPCFRDGRGASIVQQPEIVVPSTTIIILQEPYVHDPFYWRAVVHQRKDNGWWGFPGGKQEVGESLEACARREALEETGYTVSLLGAVCLDSDPYACSLVAYPDGHCVQYTNVTFLATILAGTLTPSRESRQICWQLTDALPEPFLVSHRWRLACALAHTGPFMPVR